MSLEHRFMCLLNTHRPIAPFTSPVVPREIRTVNDHHNDTPVIVLWMHAVLHLSHRQTERKNRTNTPINSCRHPNVTLVLAGKISGKKCDSDDKD